MRPSRRGGGSEVDRRVSELGAEFVGAHLQVGRDARGVIVLALPFPALNAVGAVGRILGMERMGMRADLHETAFRNFSKKKDARSSLLVRQ